MSAEAPNHQDPAHLILLGSVSKLGEIWAATLAKHGKRNCQLRLQNLGFLIVFNPTWGLPGIFSSDQSLSCAPNHHRRTCSVAQTTGIPPSQNVCINFRIHTVWGGVNSFITSIRRFLFCSFNVCNNAKQRENTAFRNASSSKEHTHIYINPQK